MLLQPSYTGFIDMHTEQARKTDGRQCCMNAKCTAAYTMVSPNNTQKSVYFSDKQKPRLRARQTYRYRRLTTIDVCQEMH